jgi:Fe2+ or Zn2+ uptake regulation protein
MLFYVRDWEARSAERFRPTELTEPTKTISFGISIKTIYRPLSDLSELGLNIFVQKLYAKPNGIF